MPSITNQIEGVETTLPFGRFVCEHEAFTSGDFDTHFVKKYFDPEILLKKRENDARLAALLALKLYRDQRQVLRTPN